MGHGMKGLVGPPSQATAVVDFLKALACSVIVLHHLPSMGPCLITQTTSFLGSLTGCPGTVVWLFRCSWFWVGFWPLRVR